MKIKLLSIVLVLITVIPLCSFVKVSPKEYTVNPSDVNSKVIVCVGDSLTNCDRYEQKLRSLLGADWEVINCGYLETTRDMLNNFQSVAVSRNPYAVIILGGRHDFAMEWEGYVTETNLYSMYKMAHDANIKVVAMSVPLVRLFPYTSDSTFYRVNSWISTAPYIDYFIDACALTESPTEPGYLNADYDFGDGTHINQLGNDVIGNAIYNALFVDPTPAPHPPANPPVIPSPPAPDPITIYEVSGGGGGGGAFSPVPFISYLFTDEGIIGDNVSTTSEDGLVNLSIDRGVLALDRNGHTLHSVRIDHNVNVPELPKDDTLLGAYDFQPKGATFKPGVKITFKCDTSNMTGKDYKIVFLKEKEWLELTDVVIGDNEVSGNTTHFSTYALVRYPKPLEEPKIVEVVPQVNVYYFVLNGIWFIEFGE